MKQRRILQFIISIFITTSCFSQQVIDSVKTKNNYGLRIGLDLSKPIKTVFDTENSGIEIVGDFRFYKNFYAAFELGASKKTSTEDYLNFTTKGSYVKAGINYNAYKNWTGMQNEIYVGFRYGFSIFDQTLNSYTPNVNGTYFLPGEFSPNTTFTGLNAHWVEFVAGLKVETFKNVFLGAQVSVNNLLTSKEPDNFANLQVPGFNRVYANNMGIGFNYSISYLIPLVKK